ncbi:fructose-6-phosphate aldolase [Candidatus Wirthbacteria bacterium CG2_30_54_11]|uniref:Probable transaldolase n=1 Tax=Candidatus Wirthbacteria bacterium CG2_30_54_11 TaxID=1817892 RepID=A0A1J5J4M4_9BACT|nr:MAG: fructose-6-phosphate aldolase [Candidatus Wirthbacteria bacterium CG2_30_54_11]
MQLFIDTANLDEIKAVSKWGVVSGVTTNPSLMAKETGADFKTTIQTICSYIDGPVSAEVISLKAKEMVKEGEKISKWHENVVIKIPTTEDGLEAIYQLSQKDIATNATLIFSANQALMVAQAGATYASPFIGRIDDMGQDGMAVLAEIMDIMDVYGFETQIISASIRHTRHVTDSALVGADIATIPYKVLKQMIRHPLTDAGIEKFMQDWAKK